MKLHIKALIVVLIIGVLSAWAFQRFVLSQIKGEQAPVGISSIEKWEKEGLPDFRARTLEGASVSLTEFEDKVVILNFWASWCGPCIEEIPSLLKLLKAFPGQIHLVAISGDSSREDIDVFLKSFPELKSADITLIWDEDRSLMKLFNVSRLPESLVADRDLKLAKKLVGSIDWYTKDSKAYMSDLLQR